MDTDLIDGVFLKRDEIMDIINKLASKILDDWCGKEIDMVIILKGAKRFASDLIKTMKKMKPDIKINKHSIKLSSYYSGTKTTEIVKMDGEIDDVNGKDVLIVEDIIDTGITIRFLLDYLKNKGVKSVKVCTLLDKPSRRVKDIRIDYVGKNVPNRFLVGYGLDWNERFRELDFIAFLNEKKARSIL